MLIPIVVVCVTFFISLLSVLIYFAAFHETRKFDSIEQSLKACETRLAKIEDEQTQIDNKINFRGTKF